jgi:hypothetical protein
MAVHPGRLRFSGAPGLLSKMAIKLPEEPVASPGTAK